MSASAARAWLAARYPGLALDAAGPLPDDEAWASCTHREDWALARAATAGDTSACAELEAGPFARARTHLRGRGFADWIVEEALQQTRIALLVPGDDGRRPGISRYMGTGPLVAFVRVVAVRYALKATPSHADETIADQLETSTPAPELATLKATYGALVREVVLDAWRALPAHDRFVLSLELHGRMSIENIAELYAIHKVSAARKLARSRSILFGDVRARLRDRMGASGDTVDSVLRLISFPVSPTDLPPATGL